MGTILITIFALVFHQSPATAVKPEVPSGSPIGLTFDGFKKVYASAKCFFADEKKPDTLEFCIVEPAKDARVVLFERFPVTREIVTFDDGKVRKVTATVSEKSSVVRKFLDEIVPKSDPLHECLERAERTATSEAEFHTKGIPEPDRAHYKEEIRQATFASEAFGCGNVSTETLTAWVYRGEHIKVTYQDEGITEMTISASGSP